jgi:hypothetical protein
MVKTHAYVVMTISWSRHCIAVCDDARNGTSWPAKGKWAERLLLELEIFVLTSLISRQSEMSAGRDLPRPPGDAALESASMANTAPSGDEPDDPAVAEQEGSQSALGVMPD